MQDCRSPRPKDFADMSSMLWFQIVVFGSAVLGCVAMLATGVFRVMDSPKNSERHKSGVKIIGYATTGALFVVLAGVFAYLMQPAPLH